MRIWSCPGVCQYVQIGMANKCWPCRSNMRPASYARPTFLSRVESRGWDRHVDDQGQVHKSCGLAAKSILRVIHLQKGLFDHGEGTHRVAVGAPQRLWNDVVHHAKLDQFWCCDLQCLCCLHIMILLMLWKLLVHVPFGISCLQTVWTKLSAQTLKLGTAVKL